MASQTSLDNQVPHLKMGRRCADHWLQDPNIVVKPPYFSLTSGQQCVCNKSQYMYCFGFFFLKKRLYNVCSPQEFIR